MKNILRLFLCLMLWPMAAWSQSNCCQQFVAFAADSRFMNKHELPLPHQYKGKEGKSITFSTLDGKPANGFLVKAKQKSNRYLFIFHEWWGLNDYVKEEAAWYAAQLKNVNVLAIDLYDGKVATTREQASEYMKAANPERNKKIIEGAMAFTGKKTKIATLGWCFGGTWSLQAAIAMGKRAKGCVIFYGMPESDKKMLRKLNTDVLGIFASQDQWITPQVVKQFEANMDSVGKKMQVKMFEADHAFANPSNPKYLQTYADEARKLTLRYLQRKLKTDKKRKKKEVL